MRQDRLVYIYAALLFAAVGLLYVPWRHGLPFFDDLYFYADLQTRPGLHAAPFTNLNILSARWVNTLSMSLTWLGWGAAPGVYRLTSALLHFLVAASLFIFLRDLLEQESGGRDRSVPAFAAAILFALHPVAVFAAGYIIERSMLLASLFSMWMWIAVHRGVLRSHRVWLLLSVPLYFLAVYSKEHAITAVGVAVLVAWNAQEGDWRKALKALRRVLPFWGGVAVLVMLSSGDIIGRPYEEQFGELYGGDNPHSLDFYVRSVVNQGTLFFRYGLYWLLPVESWMSLDMRLPFPPSWHAFPWLGGFMAYLAYPFAVGLALWRNWIPRLVFMALVSPWLLYFTMFAVVGYQETFVLYRSYLWALPGALVPALLLARLPLGRQLALLTILGLFLFGLSWSRLQTFSHPLHIWREAVERLDGRMDLPGTYRVYHNRGVEYLELGDLNRALADFNVALRLKPGFAYLLNSRGKAYLAQGKIPEALADINQAIAQNPKEVRFYISRAEAELQAGMRNEAKADFQIACTNGRACDKLRNL